MSRLQHKRMSSPEQVRSFSRGRMDVVSLDEWAVSHLLFEPGWRWSVDVRPIVKTEHCENRHLGLVISGRFHVETSDGAVAEFEPGDIYEIPPGHDAWVVGDVLFESYEFASGRLFALPPEEETDRRLTTLLFTGIVDSTGNLERLGDRRWRELLLEHNERIRALLDQQHGREVSTTGDGIVAAFEMPARAVRCAAAIVPAVRALGLEVRVGVHTGEVDFVGGNVRGLAVHLAARVMAHVGPGEVLVTATTRDLASGAELAFESCGSVELKGISGPSELWRLVIA